MHIVTALGGNALLRRGETLSVASQLEAVKRAASVLALLIAEGHHVTITHGNGPQVGLLALQSAAGPATGMLPLDVLDAESEGWIGYAIEQGLANALPSGTEVATLLSRVRVDAADPSFEHPSKPIGQTYDEATARKLAAEHQWRIAPDGAYWRRVVASPKPLEIMGVATIRRLIDAGVIVICVGGGGIPVKRSPDGKLVGAEAVVDKDGTSALLARTISADLFVMLTDVDAVYLNYGTAQARPLRRVTPDMLMAEHTAFQAGSMAPKVDAACDFVRRTGKPAAIGALDDLLDVVRGQAGTRIVGVVDTS